MCILFVLFEIYTKGSVFVEHDFYICLLPEEAKTFEERNRVKKVIEHVDDAVVWSLWDFVGRHIVPFIS